MLIRKYRKSGRRRVATVTTCSQSLARYLWLVSFQSFFPVRSLLVKTFLTAQIHVLSYFLLSFVSDTFPLSLHSPSVQFSSVTQSCPTLCDPVDCSTPGLPAHHHMSVESVTLSNHLILSAPSPPAFNLSQHQGLFK